MNDFVGKVALVTGAGGMKGIGRACALKLAAQGADLVVTDVRREQADLPSAETRACWNSILSVAPEVRALGRRCLAVWCDLTDPSAIEGLFAESLEHFGRLDVLVNNARAITGCDVRPLIELPEAVWRHTLEVNITAVFLCTKLGAMAMVRGGRGGSIVNIGSEASKRGISNMAAYSASKFAVIGLTQAAALELAPYRVRVNAVCPGATDTDRTNHWERDRARDRGIDPEEFRARVIAQAKDATPLGRIALADDIAEAVSYLAGNTAAFITGQALNVNGGTLFH